jgi:hypothetical protein
VACEEMNKRRRKKKWKANNLVTKRFKKSIHSFFRHVERNWPNNSWTSLMKQTGTGIIEDEVFAARNEIMRACTRQAYGDVQE